MPGVPVSVYFHVPGTPKPQGSKRGYINPHTNKVAMVESGGQPLHDWRGDVKRFAVDAQGETPMLEGPVGLSLRFELQKPKSHGKKKTEPISRPDLDKLARAAIDALTSVCFKDDAQIVYLMLTKGWAVNRGPGLWVNVWDLAATVPFLGGGAAVVSYR